MLARTLLPFLGVAAMMVLASPDATAAQDVGIYAATLAEPDQKTEDISVETFRGILADGSALVIDARPKAEFVNGHVPGAAMLDGPASDAATAVERLAAGDKDRAVVLYCNGPFCQASRRLGDELVAAGFTDVRRFQLGMPIWRALGGPTEIELDGVVGIFGKDRTAVFLDARPETEFEKGSIPGALNLPVEAAAIVRGAPMPADDFNTRIVLFGTDGTEARALADALSTRPWHNVLYFPGSFQALAEAVAAVK